MNTSFSKLIISVDEYNSLPLDIKNEFEWTPKYWSDPYGRESGIDGYIKGRTLVKVEADKQARLKTIRDTPNIYILWNEYNSLPPDIKNGFEWIPKGWSDPFGRESGITGYTKGRTPCQVEADKQARLKLIREA
jgi:hypothetical protein